MKTKYNTEMSKIFHKYFIDSNTSLREFCKKIGASDTLIYLYISGKRIPKLDNYYKIINCMKADGFDNYAEEFTKVYKKALEDKFRKQYGEIIDFITGDEQ